MGVEEEGWRESRKHGGRKGRGSYFRGGGRVWELEGGIGGCGAVCRRGSHCDIIMEIEGLQVKTGVDSAHGRK